MTDVAKTPLDGRLLPLVRAGRLPEALALCRDYCRGHAGDLEARSRLGLVEAMSGRFEEAMADFAAIIAAGGPGLAEAHFNAGRIMALNGRTNEAIGHYRHALEYRPDFAEAGSTLATLLRKNGRPEEARALYERLSELMPDLGNPRIHLPPETDPERIRIAGERFQSEMHSNRLFLLSYHVLDTPQGLFAASRAWDKRFGAEGRRHAFVHARNEAGHARLRIAYLSPDLREHSVSHFFLPIIAAHDREAFEIHCYAEVHRPDAMSARIHDHADHWTPTVGMSDHALASRIHADGIDVLVDLAGHTAGNRLRALTYRPAPVQATYLGYFATTGLAAMDYWISEVVLTPPETAEVTSETILRLPRCSLVYTPPREAPEVASRPAGAPLTFGCFNDLGKVTEATIALWSAILERCPGSRMAIKARQLTDATERQRLFEAFTRHGIEASRILLSGPTPSVAEHLALYAEIDIALDTLPRTGGTTTAEALWMGVPVVTLAGQRFVERLSATMLAACGLETLIASDPGDYIEKAIALAGNPAERRRLRSGLRQRVAQSPLGDAAGLARALETAYRALWRHHLDGD